MKHGPRHAKHLLSAVLAAFLLTAALAPRASAWGATAHSYINSAAVDTLPEGSSLRQFLTANRVYLFVHASDPDEWRKNDKNIKDPDKKEGPHHFIDLDAYGTPAAFALQNLPVARADADARFGHSFVQKMGTVNWTIQERTQSLANALKSGDPDRILAEAAIVGHYVGDAHVPFHSALNYDGQLSGQRGIHARFEVGVVQDAISPSDLTPEPAQVLPDVLAAARRWSGESLDLTPTILAADVQARVQAALSGHPIPMTGPLPTEYPEYRDPEDKRPPKALPKDGSLPRDYYENNTAYWTAFDSVCRPIVLARMNASAAHLGDVWLSAWTLAGKPDLSRLKAPTRNLPVPIPDPDAL